MLFYIITGIILLFYFVYPKSKWAAAVILFIAFIPQTTLLSESDQFLGFIDHRSVVSVLLILTAVTKKTLTVGWSKLDDIKKISIFLSIFLFILIPRYVEIKDGYLYDNLNIITQTKRLIRDSIFIFSILLIIFRMFDIKTIMSIERGLFFGLAIALSSMLFYNLYIRLGFQLDTGTDIDEEGNFLRLTGFLGNDPNEAARLFNISFAFILATIEKSKKISIFKITIIVLIIIGLFTVASKTGLIVFLALIFVYIIRSSKNIKTAFWKSLIILLTSMLLYHFYGSYMEVRIQQQVSGEFDSLSSRQSYWIMYLNDIIDNPKYLIIGNLAPPTYQRDVHNTYIWYLFYTGFFSFLIILFSFYLIFAKRNSYKNNYRYLNPIYLLVAILISWITGAGQLNYWFVILLAVSTGIPQYFLKIQLKHLTKKQDASPYVS